MAPAATRLSAKSVRFHESESATFDCLYFANAGITKFVVQIHPFLYLQIVHSITYYYRVEYLLSSLLKRLLSDVVGSKKI